MDLDEDEDEDYPEAGEQRNSGETQRQEELLGLHLRAETSRRVTKEEVKS